MVNCTYLTAAHKARVITVSAALNLWPQDVAHFSAGRCHVVSQVDIAWDVSIQAGAVAKVLGSCCYS